ncbi:Cell division control protein 4, partial [Frankliniella fusca]
KTTAFTKIDVHYHTLEKCLILRNGQQPKVFVNNTQVKFPPIKTHQDLKNALKNLHDMTSCVGYTDEDIRAREWSCGCLGHVPFQSNNKTVRCLKCNVARNIMKRNEQKKTFQDSMKDMRSEVKLNAQAATRFTKRVDALKSQINNLMQDIHKTKVAKLESILSTLPEEQQVLVRSCFDAAKHYKEKNRRCTTEKDTEQIPSQRTLLRYMGTLRPAFGFQENVFTLMQTKSEHYQHEEWHGALLLDEMSLEAKYILIKILVSQDKMPFEAHPTEYRGISGAYTGEYPGLCSRIGHGYEYGLHHDTYSHGLKLFSWDRRIFHGVDERHGNGHHGVSFPW